ncbi:hypothetical protein [Lacipirellula sp.]|uniref:hypothetical protein n=1 Tax=Lacipirellula sp. TaxID=2691419 RepID=UPI003D09799A
MSRSLLKPFSSLYVVIGLLLTIVLILAEFEPSGNLFFTVGLFIGQLWLIGGWAAAGRASRIVRGVGSLGGMLLMTTVISFMTGEWGPALAPSCIIAAPAFAAALVMKIILGRRERFQFQITEVLAWMVVVAIAASVLALGEFREVLSETEPLVRIVIVGGVAGLLVAFHRFRQSIPWRLRLFCWGGFAAMLVAFNLINHRTPDQAINDAFVVSAIYLAGALTASAADRRLIDATAAQTPPAERLDAIAQEN